MKKRIFILVLLALGAMAACNKIEPVTNDTESGLDETREYSFTASLPSNTKVSVDDALNAYWVKGDQLSVETSNGYSIFQLDGDGGSSQGTFKKKSGSGKPENGGLVVYPASNFSNGTYTFPSNTTYSADSFEEKNKTVIRPISTVPAVGIISYNNDELSASLKHVAGAIRVTYKEVPFNAMYMVLSTEEGYITGQASVTNTAALSLSGSPTPGNTVTVSFPNEYREEMTFIIPVPEGEYGKISFVLKDRSNNDIPGTRKATKDDASYYIPAGHMRTFIIKPNHSDVYTFEELLPGEDIDLSEADKYIYVYEESFVTETGKGYGKFSGDDNKREAVDCVIKMQDNGNGQRKTIEMYYADYITSLHFFDRGITTSEGTKLYEVQTSKGYTWYVSVDNSRNYVAIRSYEHDYGSHYTEGRYLKYLTPQECIAEDWTENTENGGFMYNARRATDSNIHIYKIVTK